jgi:hypothetical protein
MAGKVGEERYKFECEWYDQQAQINRYYMLTYYPVDKTIDMVSGSSLMAVRHKKQKNFLEETRIPFRGSWRLLHRRSAHNLL